MQAIYGQLEDAGRLVEQESQQLYSEAAGKFLADRFVIGTCPKCAYEVGDRSPHHRLAAHRHWGLAKPGLQGSQSPA